MEGRDGSESPGAGRHARPRRLLDTCQTNIMVADENYNIVYMNGTMSADDTRGRVRHPQRCCPALDSRKLIGSNIDVFHKNPAHQRRILDKLTGTLETDLKIGGRSFHLVVSPITEQGRQAARHDRRVEG